MKRAKDMACPASEAEVLGGLLLAPNRIAEVAVSLQPNAFTGPRKFVARAIWSLADGGAAVDLVSVNAWLEHHGLIGAVGGSSSLVELVKNVVSPGHVLYHAKKVGAAFSQRRMYARLQGMVSEVEQLDPGDGETLRVTLGLFAQNVDDLVRVAQPADQFSLRASLEHLRVELDSDSPRGLPSGIPEIDLAVGALHRGTLSIIGAGPGVGKSLVAGQIALNSIRADRRVLWWSGEMPTSETLLRLLANIGGLEFTRLRFGRLGLSYSDNYDGAESELASFEGSLEIIEDCPNPLAVLRTAARRMRASGGLDLVLVDHLGLLAEASGDFGARHAEVSETSRALKRLALSLEVPVLAAAQLRREYFDAEPSLGALAESSGPARDADLVLLAWRTEEDLTGLQIKVAKHRGGRVGHRFRLPVDFARMRAGSEAETSTKVNNDD